MIKKTIVGLLVLFLLSMPVACAKETAPSPTPAPAPASVPTPAPAPALTPPRTLAPPSRVDVVAVSDKNAYLPEEPITIEFSFKNITPEPMVISPSPPEMEIVLPEVEITPPDTLTLQAEVVQSLAPGSEQVELESGENVTYTLVWDQRDSNGQQVAPGYYNLNIKARNIGINGKVAGGIGTAVRVLIQYPQGAMEKTAEVNQSQTVNGLTITLERVELTSTAARFYAFTIPPDYIPPGEQKPDILPRRLPYLRDMRPVHATYTVDGISKYAAGADLGIRGDGITLTWAHPFEPLDPIPSDVRELIFIITRFGDWEGPWEFKVPLE